MRNHHDCTGPLGVSSPSPRPEPLAAGGYETSVPARPCRSGRHVGGGVYINVHTHPYTYAYAYAYTLGVGNHNHDIPSVDTKTAGYPKGHHVQKGMHTNTYTQSM